MKAASSSEWYESSPRHALPLIHQHPSTSSISSSPSLPRLHQHHQYHHHHHSQRGIFQGDSSSSSARHGHERTSLGTTSSFGSSIGASSNTETSNSNSTNHNLPHHRPPKSRLPQRQISKVLTPTITTTSSTSFSKSYSRSSQSRNTSTENTATASTSESTSRDSRLPYSFSTDANKLSGHLSSLQQRQQRLFQESSGTSFTSGNRVPSISPTNLLPPVIREEETSAEDTDATLTEVEEEEEETDEGATEDQYEEDNVYQSFKQSVKMFRVSSNENDHQRFSKPRVESPAVSLHSVLTEVEEDEEDIPPDSVDDEATTTQTEGEDDEEEGSTDLFLMNSRSDRGGSTESELQRRYFRSPSVPKTPKKVRVKVEKAVPETYFDDRVKVTVSLEETETEVSEVDEYSEEDEEEEEEEDEVSVTESETTSTNTAETVRYLRRRSLAENVARTENENDGESSEGESCGTTLSEESEDDARVLRRASYESETDYFARRTPLFPPINGVPSSYSSRDASPAAMTSSYLSRSLSTPTRNLGIPTSFQKYSVSRESGERSKESMESSRTGESSMVTCSHSGSCRCDCTTANSSGSGTTASNSDNMSSRSHSARSSLVGRASAIHKMYSVGGKLRSLSARRSPAFHHRKSPLSSVPQLQLSSDSMTPSVSSSQRTSESSGSKQFLPETHLGILPPPNALSHSRSLSAASSSRRQFSAQLRQLSLGNLQAMNPPFPKSAAHVMAEKVFKGETLPPLTPSTPSSTTSSSLKPRPFVRNLTYTVCRHSTEDSEETDSRSHDQQPTLPPARSTEHITLRQLITQNSSTSTTGTSGKSDSLHELLFPASCRKEEQQDQREGKAPTQQQVSFANNVIEHSLSSSHTLESTASENTGSTQRSDSGTEESSTESTMYCRLTGRRLQRLNSEQQEELLNKEYLTFRELQQESIEEEPDTSQERLRHFALDTIRKRMEMDSMRFRTMTQDDDEVFSDDYDFSDKEESDSTENSSEEDDEDDDEEEEGEDGKQPTKAKEEPISHIPVAASDVAVPAEAGTTDKAAAKLGETFDIEPGNADNNGEEGDIIVNQDEEGSSWKDDMKKDFEQENPEEQEEEEEEPVSLLPTRINSAESGYRAMPPSRAESSRENSMDPEELEKEKERIMQKWKESGGAGGAPPINTSINDTSSHIIVDGEIITINHSRPNTASDSRAKDHRIQNGIDLTQELPGEEKKIAAVWEEFNRDEREGGAMADYEFSTLLDEMITDVNNYKPKLSTSGLGNSNSPSHSLQVSTTQATSSSWEQPKFDPSRKYSTLSELVSLLSHNLRLVSSETLEDHMASLISLISSVLRKVRKNKTEDDYTTQVACLSTIRVLCDRLQEMTNSQNLKYADLSWLFRVLCKYSSDSDSKIRPEASFCLARLVKVAGPALVVRPIYFILVMESESGGSGKATTGAKTKAAAIDTLTYAMLTFPKEDFHNLEEIAGWVCLAMLNEERRIRQSALECLAIISQHLGGRDKALPLFHQLFLKEELDHFSRSPSPESHKTAKTGKSSKRTGKGSDPVPLSVHGTVRLLTGPGFPIAQPIDAITARLDKDVLPVPSTKGLIEYAVNVPTGKDLVLLMTHMLEKEDDEWDFSSSTDSLDSEASHSKRSSVTSLGFSDIDWTGEGPDKVKRDDGDLITPDVAYILLGKGRVNKSDVVLLDTYKKEIIPEIIQMLNEKKEGKGKKNKRRWWKNQKNKKKRKRKNKGQRRKGGPPVPTLSFDADDTLPINDDDDDSDYGQGPHDESVDVFDDPNSPVAVVVEPPPDDM